MSAPKKGGRLASIDVLRGVAVLAVFVRHLPFSTMLRPGQAAEAAVPEWVFSVVHYGEYGVHLFLLISGFCIHMRWARKGDLSAGIDFVSFWRRRMVRLYPPFIATIVMCLAGLFVFNSVLGKPTFDGFAGHFGYTSNGQFATDMVLLLLLAQNLNGASQRIGNGPFWSLALEEQLYMLYFPLLAMRRRGGWRLALPVAFAVSTLWRVGGYIGFEGNAPAFWYIVGPAHWFEWALGAMAVEAYLGVIDLPKWCSNGPLIIIGLALGVVFDLPKLMHYQLPGAIVLRDALYGGAFFVLINWYCAKELRGEMSHGILTRITEKIGLWSYSIYLTHMLVMVGAKQILLRIGLGVIPILAARLGLSVIFGAIFYRLVEHPFIVRARGKKKPKPEATVPASANA